MEKNSTLHRDGPFRRIAALVRGASTTDVVGIAGTRTLTSLHRRQKRFHNENVPFLSITGTCFDRRESGIGAQNTADRLFKRRICMSEPTDRRIRRRANIADANTISRNQWCITTTSINYHARAVHDHHDGEVNETAQDPRIEALLLQRIHLKTQVQHMQHWRNVTEEECLSTLLEMRWGEVGDDEAEETKSGPGLEALIGRNMSSNLFIDSCSCWALNNVLESLKAAISVREKHGSTKDPQFSPIYS